MIWSSYMELGEFHYSRGYVSDALKAYIQTENYITSPHHLTELCLNAILINIELGNFDQVLEYVRQAQAQAQGSPNPLDEVTVAKLHAAAGLAYMRKNEYKLAALQFLEVGSELGNNYSEVIAPQDVAIYGAFCALTTFISSEIKAEVMDNTKFQYFLALVPDASQMITSFYHGQHTVCMEYLDKLSSTLVLDCHLSMHVKTLHLVISQKSGFVILDDISVDDLFQITNTPQNDNSPEPNIRSNMMLPDNFYDDLELESSDHYTFVKCKDLLRSLDKRRSKWVSRCHSCAVLLNADLFVIDSVDSEGRDKRVDGRIVLVTDEKFSLLDVEFGSYTTTGRTLKERKLQDDEDSPVDRFEMKGDKWARRRTCLRANPGFHLLQWRRTSGLGRVQVQPLEAPPAENSRDTELKELLKTLIEQLKENSRTVAESSQDIRKSTKEIVEACSAAVTAMSGGVAN